MSEDNYESSNINNESHIQILRNQRFLLRLAVKSSMSKGLIKERDSHIKDTTEVMKELSD